MCVKPLALLQTCRSLYALCSTAPELLAGLSFAGCAYSGSGNNNTGGQAWDWDGKEQRRSMGAPIIAPEERLSDERTLGHISMHLT